MTDSKAIKISINALGGQGGGVLSGWIVKAGEKAGFMGQSTSVPGVAQRTGATVYYVELFPLSAAQAKGKAPVLALMPVPGDVDVVIASELMEAGRALSRGFVSDKTTLIASTHRVYAIDEKTGMGDARREGDEILELSQKLAKKFIAADMDKAAAEAGSVISAVLFGALAGSDALGISREIFEEVIRDSKRAVDRNLAAFDLGYKAAQGVQSQNRDEGEIKKVGQAGAPAPKVAALAERVRDFPGVARFHIHTGLQRAIEFQNIDYGKQFLDRCERIRALDQAHGGERRDWALLNVFAKHLTLWMSYEDVIKVADLKTRETRFARFREDVRAAPDQIVHVSEYMHPRVEEICDLLPKPIAGAIEGVGFLRGALSTALGEGRRVSTTKLRGYLMLSGLAAMRPIRPWSSRFVREQQNIEDWMALIESAAQSDYELGVEICRLQRLLKGYGDTFDRGLASYRKIVEALALVKMQSAPAQTLADLVAAALKDEEGAALDLEIGVLSAPANVAA